ncbi:MAG: Holliday junction branch migration protein RuvA [Phycisphaerales bacterium]|jgi:Holliday junction DNA helicase RuvA|nr:helix-hairpin-helix domain-containing protein [Planctomycetota bacterium]
MISRLRGTLESVGEHSVVVACGDLAYEVLVPAADLARYEAAVGEEVVLFTIHVLEGVSQGASYRPRLIGFATAADRSFFETFTTVRGFGTRKALRALAIPFPRVAEAIASGDVGVLSSLPEIGRKTAQTIVAELSESVDDYLREVGSNARGGGPTQDDPARRLALDAIEVLVQLGEPRPTARELVDRAVATAPIPDSVEATVTAALRLRGR